MRSISFHKRSPHRGEYRKSILSIIVNSALLVKGNFTVTTIIVARKRAYARQARGNTTKRDF